jgi:hypothetical protein
LKFFFCQLIRCFSQSMLLPVDVLANRCSGAKSWCFQSRYFKIWYYRNRTIGVTRKQIYINISYLWYSAYRTYLIFSEKNYLVTLWSKIKQYCTKNVKAITVTCCNAESRLCFAIFLAVKRSKGIYRRNFIGIPGQDGSYFAFLVSKLVASYVEGQVAVSWGPSIVLIENAINIQFGD